MSFPALFLVSVAAGFVGAMSGMGGGVVLILAMILLEIAALLLTPYVRALASLVLFVFVQRSAKHAVFTGLVLAVLS